MSQGGNSQPAQPSQLSAQQSQGGDYQQYMKQYAGDYTKYMNQSGSGSNATSGNQADQAKEKYMKQYAGDYQQYMTQYKDKYAGDNQTDYKKKYAGEYADKYMKQFPGGNKNMTKEEAIDKYAGKYAKAYVHPQASSSGPAAPKSASDCHTLADLTAWKA